MYTIHTKQHLKFTTPIILNTIKAKNNGITVTSVPEGEKKQIWFMINYENGNYVDKNKWL